MFPLFLRIFKTLSNCFRGVSLIIQLSACALTYVIVVSGFDWRYFLATRSGSVQSLLFPAVIFGGLIPMFGPICLLLIGYVRSSARTMNIAWALAQAALLGLLLSSFYKVFTGRLQPNLRNTIIDISHQFRFGFLRGGAFWGWPSSHTTVAFAMAVTCCVLYSKNRALQAGVLLYALYIGLGVSTSIHWFSEFVAGALIGSVIGFHVGQSFLRRYQEISKMTV